jgi:hypothetical protein
MHMNRERKGVNYLASAVADCAESEHPDHGEMDKSKTPNWVLTGIRASRK